MARIRVLRIKSGVDPNKPKVALFHNNNFQNYTKSQGGKYNIMVIGKKQKDDYFNNQMKAYSDKIRFHKARAPRYT